MGADVAEGFSLPFLPYSIIFFKKYLTNKKAQLYLYMYICKYVDRMIDFSCLRLKI
jgi:hypothetical protein